MKRISPLLSGFPAGSPVNIPSGFTSQLFDLIPLNPPGRPDPILCVTTRARFLSMQKSPFKNSSPQLLILIHP